jgi:3-dehydroquinate dehydratase-1
MKPMIVGTVHSPGSLGAALRLAPKSLDLVELRVDAFADPSRLLREAPRIRTPRIVTVRHPAEGGENGLTFALRRELYLAFLPHAALIDVELRSAEKLRDILTAAQAADVPVALSSHDFRRTPPITELQRRVHLAHRAGADLCKIATFVRTPAELARLLALFTWRSPLPLSVMGMGPFGKMSRLLFARLGSVLNYGYLHRANASGQWEARELKARLDEL